jgi:glucosyl-3-phosphoglycerate synthase
MMDRGPAVLGVSVRDWFARRSYEHDQFSNLGALAARKRELGVEVSVVLPCREVAQTIGAIADEVHTLNEEASLVDQLIAVDADSPDGTATIAERHGMTVYQEDELLPEFGPAAGKGDAMWRALSVVTGEVVMFLDADTTNFERHFIYGMLGPILTEREVRFAKATYHRPLIGPSGDVLDDAGRVTELTAKPLLRIFFPELSGFGQPLAGELVADRQLLCRIPFLTGYAVETAMLIDVLRATGLDAMAQVGLGARHNRSKALRELGSMSYSVARAVVERAGERVGAMIEGDAGLADALPGSFLRAVCTPAGTRLAEEPVGLVERPSITSL